MEITDKKNRKISIQVSLTGLSFCCFDTLNNTIISFNEFVFDRLNNGYKVEDCYETAFEKHPELKDSYDEITILHHNNLSTFVPTALFDANHLGNYLQYNTRVFESDAFAFDEMIDYQINTVYIPHSDINNFFVEKYNSFDYKHSSSILLKKLMDLSRNKPSKTMWVHFAKDHFEIIVIENQKLLLYNSFNYNTPEDFLYYILFTAEQLNMNPDNFGLELIGNITINSEFYKLAYKYIRNVKLIDVEDLRWNNYFSEHDNRKYYILFNS